MRTARKRTNFNIGWISIALPPPPAAATGERVEWRWRRAPGSIFSIHVSSSIRPLHRAVRRRKPTAERTNVGKRKFLKPVKNRLASRGDVRTDGRETAPFGSERLLMPVVHGPAGPCIFGPKRRRGPSAVAHSSSSRGTRVAAGRGGRGRGQMSKGVRGRARARY